jgi:hypothetical protein
MRRNNKSKIKKFCSKQDKVIWKLFLFYRCEILTWIHWKNEERRVCNTMRKLQQQFETNLFDNLFSEETRANIPKNEVNISQRKDLQSKMKLFQSTFPECSRNQMT